MDVSLSVIVTAYNCEKYIQRCINSVIKQTYKDLEIIIVDDGSVDSTSKLCDDLAETYSQVYVIHKKNGGTVSARKAGINASCGEVVCFIDGDDWVDGSFCENMMKIYLQNKSLEMVSSGLIFEYVETPEKNYQLCDVASAGFYDRSKIQRKILPYCIYDYRYNQSAITTSVCCKFIKKELAKKAIERLDERLTYGEDGAFVLALLLKAQNLYVCKEAWYHYEQHQASQNKNYGEHAWQKLQLLKECMDKIGREADISEKVQEQIDYYIKSYLIELERKILRIKVPSRIYAFPTRQIGINKKIIVHGAGEVGKQYVKFLQNSMEYELIAWTDKKSEKPFVTCDEPCSLETLKGLDYDFAILAATDCKVRKQMKEDMRAQGVPEKKILDCNPIIYRV